MNNWERLAGEMARALVDNPELVRVREISGTNVTVLELRVAPTDLGKVIGHQGRLANAMRCILAAAGAKRKRKVELEILE
jgi:hypothetical protein